MRACGMSLPSKGAIFAGHDKEYRVLLWRLWTPTTPPLGWVMLNPSTADGEEDDATIRRCAGFARREGAGGIVVTNLYAYRATYPRELWAADQRCDIVGGHAADEQLDMMARRCPRVVLAWGNPPRVLKRWVRSAEVISRLALPAIPPRLFLFGRTQQGNPRHPLRVRADAPLVPLELDIS